MSDILHDAANAFLHLLQFDYHITLGDKKRRKTLSIITNEKDMFTHICGLDHLKDITKVTAIGSTEKIAVLRNILNKNTAKAITFQDIAPSVYLYENMSNKINPRTGKPYNIYDRILHINDIESILDNADNGTVYRWNNKKGGERYCKIRADYVLEIPSATYPDEKHYFFLVNTGKNKSKHYDTDNTPCVETKIMSAFSDRSDLTRNQDNPQTILEISKIIVKTHNVVFTKMHPSYQNQKDAEIAACVTPKTNMHPINERMAADVAVVSTDEICRNSKTLFDLYEMTKTESVSTQDIYDALSNDGIRLGNFNAFKDVVKRAEIEYAYNKLDVKDKPLFKEVYERVDTFIRPFADKDYSTWIRSPIRAKWERESNGPPKDERSIDDTLDPPDPPGGGGDEDNNKPVTNENDTVQKTDDKSKFKTKSSRFDEIIRQSVCDESYATPTSYFSK